MNHNRNIIISIVLYVFLILLLVSPDSYTHDLLDRTDSAWFFTCGKAWMNGMTPYVDFADSKGPLLWFIYGVGYLISPYNYIGVFWLSVILYSFVYFWIYKTSNIFLNDPRLSFICAILLSLSFFCPWFHDEVRAEDWCQLFISWSLYRACDMIYGSNTRHNYYLSFSIFGLCLLATLLIKYNITVMLAGIVAYCFYYAIRKRISLYKIFISSISGAFLGVLPFMLYFLYKGNLSDFINEYFLNTFKTIQDSNSISNYIHEWLLTMGHPERMILFALSIAGALLMGKSVKNDKYFFLYSFLCFYAIAIHHAFEFYLCSCLIFILWFIISFVSRYKDYMRGKKNIIVLAATVLAFITIFNYTFAGGYLINNLFFKDTQYRKDLYNIGYLMSQVPKPTIIYFQSTDHGYGVLADALPGSKYWSSQTGATTEMEQVQVHDVLSGKSDFVMIDNVKSPLSKKITLLEQSGYHKCYSYQTRKYIYELYTKKQLKPIPDNFHVTWKNIILKRNFIRQDTPN